ncbi:MAG: putative ABC transporter permease [Bacillota bacterium]|jgi:uncharacterized membrane protein
MDRFVNFTRSESFEMLFVFLIGAFGYGLLELFWRGRTHYSMLITGGLCFFIIYFLNLHYADKSLLFKCMLGMIVITALEFLVGVLVNKILLLQVWDYSSLPYNLMGQVCLLYSAFWFCLGIPLAFLTPVLHRFILW